MKISFLANNIMLLLKFKAENEADREEWMSVLLNSKDGALNQAFQDNGKSNSTNQGFLELQRTLVTFIRGLPGNDKCCDCGSNNGKSLSCNVVLLKF